MPRMSMIAVWLFAAAPAAARSGADLEKAKDCPACHPRAAASDAELRAIAAHVIGAS